MRPEGAAAAAGVASCRQSMPDVEAGDDTTRRTRWESIIVLLLLVLVVCCLLLLLLRATGGGGFGSLSARVDRGSGSGKRRIPLEILY